MNTTTDSDTDGSEPASPSDPDEPARSHVVARARRMRAVHLKGPDSHTCGLCLNTWPCPPRAWADKTLGHPRK
jgi:hypothetical protein